MGQHHLDALGGGGVILDEQYTHRFVSVQWCRVVHNTEQKWLI
jgi:hypothetical protein